MRSPRPTLSAFLALGVVVQLLSSPGARASTNDFAEFAVITTFAGSARNGPALDVGHQARGVTVEGSLVYVTDELNAVVRVIDLTTGLQRAAIGVGAMGSTGDGGLGTQTQIDIEPGSRVGVSDGAVYVPESGNDRIRRVSAEGVVTTIGGTGERGYSGDGGPALDATFNTPYGVVVDDEGDVFVADTGNHAVRRIGTDGIVTTVAGSGRAGSSGDGGPAVSARLSSPLAVDIDADGGLIIADTFGYRVRRVGPDGVIRTIAGGAALFGQPLPISAGDGGPATSAAINLPFDAQVDATGNVYVADWGGNRIRRVDTAGTITTVAGTGAPGFAGDGGPALLALLNGPTGVAPASDGSLYIADMGNKRIRRVDPRGIITTVSGNGTTGRSGDGDLAVNAQANGSFQADVDAAGNVYIADMGNDVIRKVGTDGVMSTVAGNAARGYGGDGGPATDATLQLPFGVAAAPDGSFYIADSFNHRIRRVTPDGTVMTVAGNGAPGFLGDGGPALAGSFAGIIGIDVDRFGNLFIADSGNNRIRLVTPNGFLWTVVGTGFAESTGDGGPALSAGINRPVDVDASADGSLYIVEQGGQRVRRVALDPATFLGSISTVAGSGPDIAGADCFDPRLQSRQLPPLGDGGPATQAHLSCPTGVAADAAGNVFIADFFSSRVRMVDAGSGIIRTVAGTDDWGLTGDGGPAAAARLYGPTDVVVDGHGDVLVVDHGNNRVRKLTDSSESRRLAHSSWPVW